MSSMYGSNEQILDRISKLERFKSCQEFKFNSTIPKNLMTSSEYINLNLLEPFTREHAAKLNMALAIRNLDFDYFREELFNANLLSFYDMHYNYALFKHTFLTLLTVWNPSDEKVDDIIGKLLSELHQVDQIFYHWSWYIFPRVLELYSEPHEKLRFLFKYGIEINDKDHSWNNLLDCPTKISLSRRPRPIIQLLFRTGLYYSFEHSAWVGLVEKLKLRDDGEPGFLNDFWHQFEIELNESRHSSLWEQDGRDFEGESVILKMKNIKMNIPLHVWMNNNIKWTPYFAKAVWKVLGEIPEVIFAVLELQCNYCTRNSKTVRVIHEIFTQYHDQQQKKIVGQKNRENSMEVETEPSRELPFNKKKIKSLRYLCRSRKNIF